MLIEKLDVSERRGRVEKSFDRRMMRCCYTEKISEDYHASTKRDIYIPPWGETVQGNRTKEKSYRECRHQALL